MKGATALSDALSALPEDEQLITMAVAVLRKRIDALPSEDRDELFELVQELPRAKTAEEVRSLWTAIQEILAQRPMTARPLPPVGDRALAGKSKRWAQAVGKRVRRLRSERGWTQVELAERAGLPQSHVCRIERAVYTATFKTLDKIARAFGVEAGQIDPSST
jgi:DNA-binding XRE family transcriptional regulator